MKLRDIKKENGELISFYKIEITDENNNSITEVPIMIAHTIVEIASVVIVLITSIDPSIYQSWLSL